MLQRPAAVKPAGLALWTGRPYPSEPIPVTLRHLGQRAIRTTRHPLMNT
jgi:hypothetical protein